MNADATVRAVVDVAVGEMSDQIIVVGDTLLLDSTTALNQTAL